MFSVPGSMHSVYPRNKKGHFKRALNDQKGHFMRALRDQKGHIYCLRSPPPPPPTCTNILKRFLYSLFVYCICSTPNPIQHSFLCSFKWMSLLNTVPQPKKILCSLFTYMVFVPLKICRLICSLIANKMSLFPQNAWEEIC